MFILVNSLYWAIQSLKLNSHLQLSVMKLEELETNGDLPSTEICHMFLKPTAAGGWRERGNNLQQGHYVIISLYFHLLQNAAKKQ